MTSQGSDYARFLRALATRNLSLVRPAALELGRIELAHALEILVLIADQDPARYPRAGARWLGRVALERRLTLDQLGDVLDALEELPRDPRRILPGLRQVATGLGGAAAQE